MNKSDTKSTKNYKNSESKLYKNNILRLNKIINHPNIHDKKFIGNVMSSFFDEDTDIDMVAFEAISSLPEIASNAGIKSAFTKEYLRRNSRREDVILDTIDSLIRSRKELIAYKFLKSCPRYMLDRLPFLERSIKIANALNAPEVLVALLRRVIYLDPKNSSSKAMLALEYMRLGQYLEARELVDGHQYDWVTNKEITHARILLYMYEGNLSDALKLIETEFQKNKTDVGLLKHRANVMMKCGPNIESLAAYDIRKAMLSVQAPRPGIPEWDGKRVLGNLFVVQEQGDGDIIQFGRFLKEAASLCLDIYVGCNERVAPLFEELGYIKAITKGKLPNEISAWCLIGDLPLKLGIAADNVKKQEKYMETILSDVERPAGERLKVGIVWQGNANNPRDSERSIPSSLLYPLLQIPFVDVVNIQVEENTTTDVDEQIIFKNFLHSVPSPKNYLDTAKIVMGLDLIISVDTSVIHLAAALGKKCWVVLRGNPDWRWGDGTNRSAWYPSVRQFRADNEQNLKDQFEVMSTILARWATKRKIKYISDTSSRSIAKATGLRQQAIEYEKRGHIRSAVSLLMASARLNPNDPQIWEHIGLLLKQLELYDLAYIAYRKAESLGGSKSLFANLANVLGNLGRPIDGVLLHRKNLTMESGKRQQIVNYGLLSKKAGLFNEAVLAFDKAYKLDSSDKTVLWDRSHALIQSGKFKEGWKDYGSRKYIESYGFTYSEIPDWDRKALNGKTLLVYPEQGFGDAIFASRYIPTLLKLQKNEKVVLAVKPELRALFARSFDIELVPNDPFYLENVPDVKISLMDLPYLCDKKSSMKIPMPYLTASTKKEEWYQSILPKDKLNVGIIWSGSITFADNSNRSTDLENFAGLAAHPLVNLVSLQKGERARELDDTFGLTLIRDFSDHLSSFDETSAIINALDLVIMTDSSVAHLAGALNKPIWLALGYNPYWLWGSDKVSKYYPSLKTFRQDVNGDWRGLFEKIEVELFALAERKLDTSCRCN